MDVSDQWAEMLNNDKPLIEAREAARLWQERAFSERQSRRAFSWLWFSVGFLGSMGLLQLIRYAF